MLWKQDQEIKLKQLNHFSINLVSLTKLVCPDEKVVIDKLSQQNNTSAFQINAPWILNIAWGKKDCLLTSTNDKKSITNIFYWTKCQKLY